MFRNDGAPLVIFNNHLSYLLPSYYLLNALILRGKPNSELAFREGLLQAQIGAGILETVWVAKHPLSLPRTVCGLAAGLSAIAQGSHVLLAFSGSSALYNSSVAMFLHLIALVMQIPVSQLGNNYTLFKRISPARYRILGWLVAVVIAISVLFIPELAGVYFALPCTIAPQLVTIYVLFLAEDRKTGSARDDKCNHDAGDKETDNDDQVNGSRANGDNANSDQRAGLYESLAFVFLGLGFGTLGEAFTDMATALSIRRSLQKGNKQLAFTNHVVVFFAMLLAYWSETKPSADRKRKAVWFILAWAACQGLRVAALHHLDSGQSGYGVLCVLSVMVFLDKYTGPLGTAALEVALLELLQPVSKDREVGAALRVAVPTKLLWTLRMIVWKLERPICQLILLYYSHTPVEVLSASLTLMTVLGVVAVLWAPGSATLAAAKAKEN